MTNSIVLIRKSLLSLASSFERLNLKKSQVNKVWCQLHCKSYCYFKAYK